MDELQERLSKSIVLLLPSYLEGMIEHWTWMGFCVIHSYYPEVLEAEIKEYSIDLAIEWQHGPDDFQVRDLVRKCGKEKEVPILFTCNWNGRLPPNFSNLGYRDYLNVPWSVDSVMSKFHEVLPESKKPVLKDLWEKAEKRG